jgi:serine/threonine-protein kinase
VGPFTLDRLLGRGGMGEVWLAARDEGGFRQEVALKLLKRGMDSEDLLRRFVQERRILAGLSHPSIARFIDGGVGDDGAPWYAMEYVDGVPVTDHARTKALDVRARVALVAEVAEAVAYAQNRLVVHRDLKPSNILVDAQGRTHLLDFGIAKLLEAGADADATATGLRAMSPAYAAPEQILDEPISAATDVYALGVVLYELLTGALPHERASATLETLAERVRHEAPERPSHRLRKSEATTTTTLGADANTAQRFARAMAGELDTIALTALRREPDRRYASAAAFADDLRRWLDGRPVAAQADTATYRMRKFVARHRLAVGSASAVLLALIAGFGTALWQASVAREQAARAEAQAQRAEAINEFMQSLFREQDPLARTTAAARTPGELVASGIERARRQFAESDPLRWELLDDLAALQVALGDFAPAAQLLDAVIASHATAGERSGLAQARSRSMLAVALAGLGKFDQGLAMGRAAADALRGQLGPDHPDTVRADARVLRLWIPTGTEAELSGAGTELLERASRVLGPSAPDTLAVLASLTSIQERFDRYDAMQRSVQDLIGRIERDMGPDHLLLARPLARLGDLERVMQRYPQALPYFDRALAIARQQESRPLVGVILMRRGDNLRRMQRNDEAERDFAEAAGLMPADSAEAAQLEQMRGVLANARGDRDAAVAHFARSQQAFERALGKPSIYSWTSAVARVGVELERGAAREVEALALEADAAMRELSPPPSFDVFLSTGTLAQVQAALGQDAAAQARFVDAIAIGVAVYGPEHPSVTDLRLKRIAVLPAGRSAPARAELESILAISGLSTDLRVRAQAQLARR